MVYVTIPAVPQATFGTPPPGFSSLGAPQPAVDPQRARGTPRPRRELEVFVFVELP